MVEESRAAESKTTTPLDLSKLLGGFDPSKIMDQFTKFLRNYKVPGVDVAAVLESSRKNVEALANANKQALEAWQAVITRQGEFLRETMDGASTALKDISAAKSPTEAAAKQGELVRSALEKALTNMREMAEIMAKSNTDAFETINNRVSESLDEIREITATLRK